MVRSVLDGAMGSRLRRAAIPAVLLLAVACGGVARSETVPPPTSAPARPAVAALGRIQPKDGVLRVAGPSFYFAVVVDKLEVEEGDTVRPGQVIAILDHYRVMAAAVTQMESASAAKEAAVVGLRAELENARQERERQDALHRAGLATSSDRDLWVARHDVAAASLRRGELELAAARADLARSRLERDRAIVRSPVRGQVLKIHARPGAKVGDEGIAELGRTDEMYVVAEVYEQDIPRVHGGQRAVVRSPVLGAELQGRVERIGRMVGKNDVLGTDPAAKADMRVLEVEIRLDDPAPVRGLTHLTVDVEIRTP
jgi:HlyD family secretion protein